MEDNETVPLNDTAIPVTWYKVYRRLEQVMKTKKASSFSLFMISDDMYLQVNGGNPERIGSHKQQV